jgi:CBS domain containing-hemolysin-like protein
MTVTGRFTPTPHRVMPLVAVAVLALGVVLMPAASQAQHAPDAARRAAMEARRDSLETAIMQRFLDQLDRELALDAGQRTQTERVLRMNAVRRRHLMRASGELRGRMVRASRDQTTTDAEFTRLLADHESLRQRENEIWRLEQEELAGVLSPRQRTQLIMHWVRFQEEVRDIIMQQMRPGR